MKSKILVTIAGLSLACAGFASGAQADPWPGHDGDHPHGEMREHWRHHDRDDWRRHEHWRHHCRVAWRHHHRVRICP